MTPQNFSSHEKDILFDVRGAGGWIQLNRPSSLNALNSDMIMSLYDQLTKWKDDPVVTFVVIEGKGRAFCAGGDIRMFIKAYQANTPDISESILLREYDTNLLIHKYPKPYVSILDGITMGGGMGVSIHGSHRVVTENTVMAMPETAIGFFPDVGARWFFNRAPGHIGLYLALTAQSIDYKDALYCGFGTHFISADKLEPMKKELRQVRGEDLDIVLDHYHENASDAGLKEKRPLIDELFHQSTIEDIFRALSRHKSEFARETLELLEKKSPRSLRIVFEAMNVAKNMSIEEVIEDDKILCTKFTRHPEFMEGIRAAVVDKDRSPKWLSEPIKY